MDVGDLAARVYFAMKQCSAVMQRGSDQPRYEQQYLAGWPTPQPPSTAPHEQRPSTQSPAQSFPPQHEHRSHLPGSAGAPGPTQRFSRPSSEQGFASTAASGSPSRSRPSTIEVSAVGAASCAPVSWCTRAPHPKEASNPIVTASRLATPTPPVRRLPLILVEAHRGERKSMLRGVSLTTHPGDRCYVRACASHAFRRSLSSGESRRSRAWSIVTRPSDSVSVSPTSSRR